MLVSRIVSSFDSTGFTYEIVFVDDRSTDGTQQAVQDLSANHPVRLVTKVGPRGKAHSLLQGFRVAEYDTICMIDADLQYPPEAIIPMYQLMESSNTDVVLTNRTDNSTSVLRKIATNGFNFVFTKMLFGFDYDSQSGLKLFKKKVINNVELNPTPWSFDLEFIVRSLEKGYKINTYDITFAERYAGQAKINVVKAAFELAKASLKLRLDSSPQKVKRAYQTNTRFTQKSSQAALLVATLLAGLIIIPVRVSALDPVGFVKNVFQDFTTQPQTYTPEPTVAPTPDTGTNPTVNTSQPSQPSSTPVAVPATTTTATPAATQKSTTTQSSLPKTSRPATSTTSTTTTSTTPAQTVALTNQPAVAATYPVPNKSAGNFSYAAPRNTASKSYIKPLATAGIAVLVATTLLYSTADLLGKNKRSPTFQGAVNE